MFEASDAWEYRPERIALKTTRAAPQRRDKFSLVKLLAFGDKKLPTIPTRAGEKPKSSLIPAPFAMHVVRFVELFVLARFVAVLAVRLVGELSVANRRARMNLVAGQAGHLLIAK